ncbi:MAG TPA: VOC family protein [Pyrinomonadaceae bacterium]|jgi:catechol 2,3-dioxygenase-like lactoylglutathione lyase family enzyme|nr:VOC family protein [Pyrinomonadaceae bacterium]
MSSFETGHIGLNVNDLERSKAFYQEVFGFELRGESTDADRKFAMLANDGKLILTLWQQSSAAFNKQTAGLHHLSFQAKSVGQIKEIETKLREKDVKLIYDGIVLHGEGAKSGGIFFEDPDGIRLEIFTTEGLGEFSAPETKTACGFF